MRELKEQVQLLHWNPTTLLGRAKILEQLIVEKNPQVIGLVQFNRLPTVGGEWQTFMKEKGSGFALLVFNSSYFQISLQRKYPHRAFYIFLGKDS